MYLSTLLAGACAIASAFAAPVQTTESCTQEAAHVTGPDGKVYHLSNTETNNIRIITSDRKDDYYIRPNSYHVASSHTCKFYSEATRGVGYLIGQFTGPMEAVFGSTEWAAFYECWDAKVESRAPVVEARNTPINGLCGVVTSSTGEIQILDVEGRRKFAINGESYHPVAYSVLDHCICSIGLESSRSGATTDMKISGLESGRFSQLLQPHSYDCSIIEQNELRSLQR